MRSVIYSSYLELTGFPADIGAVSQNRNTTAKSQKINIYILFLYITKLTPLEERSQYVA